MSARQPGHMPMCTHTEAIRQRLPLFLSLLLFYRLSSQKRAGLADWLAVVLGTCPALQSKGTGMNAWLLTWVPRSQTQIFVPPSLAYFLNPSDSTRCKSHGVPSCFVFLSD